MLTNINQKYSLSLFLWNTNAIIQHTNKFLYILHLRKIDVALITETYLMPTKCIG